MSPISSDEAIENVLIALPGVSVRGANIGGMTTYRVGGPARVLVVAESVEQLSVLCRVIALSAVSVVVLGFGSNMLVSDDGFDGVAVCLASSMSAMQRVDITTIRVGARASLPVLARWSVEEGLTGFEWAVGVPGTVGGAVRMNAGGHGSEMSHALTRVRVFDLRTGEDVWMQSSELYLAYRGSALQAHDIVVEAEFSLKRGDRQHGADELKQIVSWRRSNQPGGRNAGSVFANPPDDSAGRLIDMCGLKGFRIGSAHVSTKHANFIQSDEGGTATDVFSVMSHVRREVVQQQGVTLRIENELVGFSTAQRTELGLS